MHRNKSHHKKGRPDTLQGHAKSGEETEDTWYDLALFLKKVKNDGGLKYSQNVFFRYLSCPEHCNLAISENSLKALISEAIQRLF